MVRLFIDPLVQLRHFTAILVAVAALGPSGCATEGGGIPDQGPFISPTLDAGRHASALIGPEGGSVEATGADGTRYTLTIPADALIAETEIALTPITAIDDLPMSGGLVGAVHFEPSGLELFRAASLTVELASAPVLGSEELFAGFVYDGDGKNLALSLVRVDDRSFTLPVRHFSGGGAGAATRADLEAAFAPGTADAFIAKLVAALDSDDADAIEATMRGWYQTIVKPGLQAAVSSDAALERGLAGHGRWLDFLLQLAESSNDLVPDLFSESYGLAAAALRDAIARANDTCERQQSFAQAEKALLWQRRAESMLPEAVRLANGLDRRSVVLDLCVQVVFESTSFPQVPIAGEPEPLHVVVGYAFGTGAVERAAGMELSVYAGSQIPTSASAETDASGEVELSVTPPAGTLEIEVVACIGRVPGAGLLTGALICQQAFIVRGLVVLPGIVDLAPGSSQQFVAQVLGIDEPVTWSAIGGTIDANGLFTAGSMAGIFTVSATSTADSSVRADASVTISGA
ncbi:MAG: hypothetical protein HKN10_06885, partial [Myxococcales bacterium]|nr:hypothetical protein [Myxococcales bacterium]